MRKLVIERRMDSPVRRRRRAPQAVEVFHSSQPHTRAHLQQLPTRRLRARQPRYLMPRCQQLLHNGKSDKSRRARHKNLHRQSSSLKLVVCGDTIYAVESLLLSRSSKTAADPLSDVLSLLKPRGYMSGGIDAGGDWAIQFDNDGYFRCFALVSGHCWLVMEGLDHPVRLSGGDFVVLPHGRTFRVASDLHLAPVDIMTVITAPLNGNIFRWKGGGACLALSALFTFAGDFASLLLGVLPALVHIRKQPDREAMRWYLERMMKVIREPQPGGLLLAEHLAQMMLIEVLGLYMADTGTAGTGWFFALADRQLSAAMGAMHADPSYRWTVQRLAERACMSRSAFALRFKLKVGTSAIDYLTHWRMLRAAEMLVNSRESVSAIALSLGYESVSSFGFAFKREMGCSPRQFCRARAKTSPMPSP